MGSHLQGDLSSSGCLSFQISHSAQSKKPALATDFPACNCVSNSTTTTTVNVLDSLRFDEFCTKLTDLFGSGSVEEKDLKVVFRKISTNPDAVVDWCEVRVHVTVIKSVEFWLIF